MTFPTYHAAEAWAQERADVDGVPYVVGLHCGEIVVCSVPEWLRDADLHLDEVRTFQPEAA